MLDREELLELTRRMTPARTSIGRIAGSYFDEEGQSDGSFCVHFGNLSPAEKEYNLRLAKTVPFSETNVQLREYDFPGETRESGDMMRLLDAILESRLKNAALAETFCEVAAERQPKGEPFAVFLFCGAYDVPRKGTDKAEQWESEDVYEYLICTISPVSGNYEAGEPVCGFLYPSFRERGADLLHIAVYEKVPGVSGEGLLQILGCEREA